MGVFLFCSGRGRHGRELAEEGDLRIGHARKEPGKDPPQVDQREKQCLPRVPGREVARPTEGITILRTYFNRQHFFPAPVNDAVGFCQNFISQAG